MKPYGECTPNSEADVVNSHHKQQSYGVMVMVGGAGGAGRFVQLNRLPRLSMGSYLEWTIMI